MGVLVFSAVLGSGSAGAVPVVGDLLSSPTPGKATEVRVDIYVDDLTDIDVAKNTFRITAQMVLEWRDPRVVSLFGPNDGNVRIFENQGAEKVLTSLWSPEVEIVNERGQRNSSIRALRIQRDGKAVLYEKFDSEAGLDGDLYLFPFVNAQLRLAVSALLQDQSEMQLRVGTFQAQAGKELDHVIFGPWNFVSLEKSATSTVRSHEPDKEYSVVEYSLEVRRDALSGVGFAILPILLIWLISSALLWIDAAEFTSYGSPRIGGLITLLLTTVALQLTLENRVPRVQYFTAPEILIYLAMLMLAVGILLSIVYVHRFHNGSKEAARKMDRQICFGYPIVSLFLGMVFVALGFLQER